MEACGGKACDRNAIEPKALTYGSVTEAEVDELTEEAELAPLGRYSIESSFLL